MNRPKSFSSLQGPYTERNMRCDMEWMLPRIRQIHVTGSTRQESPVLELTGMWVDRRLAYRIWV